MSHFPLSSLQIVTELNARGYKMDSSTNDRGVFFDVGGGDGEFRSYAIEGSENGWSINQKAVSYEDGEEAEEESEIGTFSSAVEIADAIDEAEEEF
jgi:hypothetical protein